MPDYVFMLVLRSEERQGRRLLHTVREIFSGGLRAVRENDASIPDHVTAVEIVALGKTERLEQLLDE